jgi:CIC family chloride channel protein
VYALAALTGAAAGLAAVAFEVLSGGAIWLLLQRGAGYVAAGPHGEPHLFPPVASAGLSLLALVLLPALGGVASSLLCRRFAPEASGHGTDAVIDAYHNRDGVVRARVPIVKGLATALTLGSGGSGGREGPIAQMGAGFGSWLATSLGLGARQRRILLAAGMGAGVGAIFRAPLAGALFASEILYREAELESEAIMPSFIACSVAYCVFCGVFQDFGTLFRLTGDFVFTDLAELLPYTILALAVVPAGWAFTRCFYGMERVFARVPGPRPLVAGLGGLLCGASAVGLYLLLDDPYALSGLSQGYGVLQAALDGKIDGGAGVRLLALVAGLKILTTSFTISSGGSAGVFGPSMVIGGGLGGAIGLLGAHAGWIARPGCFVIVGMCGFFAGAAKTPISTIIMVCEMTGSYDLLLPAMWVCGLSFLLSHRFALYRKQVPNRAFSAAHRGEFTVPLLQGLRVRDVLERERRVTTVRPDEPLSEIVRLVAAGHDDYFPVVDPEGRFVGIFSAHDVREHTYDDALHRLVVAADIMTVDPIVLTPDDDLHAALERFSLKNLDELPVVESANEARLVGMLRRRAITRAYNERLKQLRTARAAEGSS